MFHLIGHDMHSLICLVLNACLLDETEKGGG